MIELLRYKVELRKLRKAQKELSEEFKQVYDRVSKKGYDVDGELSSAGNEEEDIENWINYRQTQYYQHICEQLIMPVPDIEDSNLYYKYNFDDDQRDRNILTTAGLHSIRNPIREEKKRKREVFSFWFTIVIGFMGALIGLISVWKK